MNTRRRSTGIWCRTGTVLVYFLSFVLAASAIAKFPLVPKVERLIVLADHDAAGQRDARTGAERWRRAGRTAVLLTPKRPGADFNDLVMERAP